MYDLFNTGADVSAFESAGMPCADVQAGTRLYAPEVTPVLRTLPRPAPHDTAEMVPPASPAARRERAA